MNEGTAGPGAIAAATLDLAHLSLQCAGERDLERELLALFREQGEAIAAQLLRADAPAGLRLDLAHKLKGSSRAIGARELAQACECLERAAGEAGEGAALAALSGAAERAFAAVGRALDPGAPSAANAP